MANILIVDDVPDSCEPVKCYLERDGHHVVCAASGRAGLSEVLSNTPDLIIVDLMMPEMDGPSFLEVIRSYLRLQSLPVIVYTAMGASPMIDRVRAMNIGTVLLKGSTRLADIGQAVDDALAGAPG